MAYRNYKKEFNALKGYLRGEACDRNILTDTFLYVPFKIRKKYYKKFLSELVSDGEEKLFLIGRKMKKTSI